MAKGRIVAEFTGDAVTGGRLLKPRRVARHDLCRIPSSRRRARRGPRCRDAVLREAGASRSETAALVVVLLALFAFSVTSKFS
jgi:hypothetical protein